MHNVVLGIDPGLSHVGVAVVRFLVMRPSVLHVGTIEPPDKAETDKLDVIAPELWRLADLHRPEAIAIEDVSAVEVGMQAAGRTNKRSRRMHDVCGIARGIAAALGVPVYEISSTTAKQTLTGSGRADKDLMMAAARRLFGVPDVSEHGADALGIAKAGHARHNIATLRAYANDSLRSRAQLGHVR